MENYKDISVAELGIPLRAINVLQKNDINTLADLIATDEDKLITLPGMGNASYEAIKAAVEAYFNDDVNADSQMQMSEYLRTVYKQERNYSIVVDYYRTGSDMTLEKIGEKYNITRERARQVLFKNQRKVRDGLALKKISGDILKKMDEAALKQTEISLVGLKDDVLGCAGLVKMVAVAYPERYEIVRGRHIYGEWLVLKESDTQKMLDYVVKALRDREAPMSIKDIQALFAVNEEILMSLKCIIEKDGYVTVKGNKEVLGIGRLQKILEYFDRVKRPVSAHELLANTDLTENQVRGGLCASDYFVNVGKSVYDLVDADYSALSLTDLIKNYMVAENRALKVDQITKYVKRYRDVEDADIVLTLFAHDSGFRREGDLILLNEWGNDKIEKFLVNDYTITLEEAIPEIFKENDDIMNAEMVAQKLDEKYGDNVSRNINSIKSTLGKLAWDEKLIKVGEKTGFYRRARKNLS